MPRPRRASPPITSFSAIEKQIDEHVSSIVSLVDKIADGVAGKDCRSAVESYEDARKEFGAISRKLTRASSISEQLRRRGELPATSRAPAGAACPVDREECGYQLDGGTCTISAALTLPARGGHQGTERVRARYCVVDIGQLHTSHKPLEGFRPDPKFPADAQERDYQLPAERAKVEEIAEHYDPALIFNTSPGAVDGVPVVTESRIVLGGNGRTMATALVYAGRGGVEVGTPRQWLIEHAHEFGLSPDAIERLQRPMLVRTVRVKEDARNLAEWSRRLNTSLSQQLDATRLAVSRARFVDDGVLRELEAMDDDETLASFLSSSRSKGFVRALQRSGIVDGRAAQLYLGPDGLLSEAGRDLAADLLVAVLVPDAQLIGAYGRGPVGVIARAAPALVRASSWPEYDIRKPLRAAVRDRVAMAAQQFERVRDYLRQDSLLSETKPAVGSDARAIALLHILAALDGAPVKFTRFARRYVELAGPAGRGQSALFASESVSPLQALLQAADSVGVKVPQ